MVILLILACTGCTQNGTDSTSHLMVDTSFIVSTFDTDEFTRIGGDSIHPLLPVLTANGGFETADASYTGENGGSFMCEVENEPSLLLTRLAREEYDIAVLPLQDYLAYRDLIASSYPIVFCLTGWSNGAHSIVSYNSELTTIRGLPGRTVLAVEQSASYHLASFFMQQLSIPPDSINWIYAASRRELARNLEKSEADASESTNGIVQDGRTILSTADLPRFIPYVALATRKYMLTHKSELSHFIHSVLYGGHMLSTDPEGAIETLSRAGVPSADIAEAISAFLPTTYRENASFFGLSNEYRPDINTILYYDLLAPEKSRVRPKRAYHSLYDTDMLTTTAIDMDFADADRPAATLPDGERFLLFTVAVPLSDSTDIDTAVQKRALSRAGALHALAPSAEVEISFEIQQDSAVSYHVRMYLERAALYARKNDIFQHAPSIDYQTMYQIEKGRYDGPFAAQDRLIIRFYGRR
ncbi:MAG: hypothetical protein ACOCWH_02360 [Spirochaetota bacterium]